MIAWWNLRLGLFLFTRVLSAGHDKRFDQIKRSPGRFFVAWTLQALWVYLDSLPVIATNAAGDDVPLGASGFALLTLWAVGFLIQVLADKQKHEFRKDPANHNRFIKTGVWRFSRHPNYFGQMVGTVSLAAFCLPCLSGGWAIACAVSPLFEVLLLRFVSGVPLLEAAGKKRWGEDAEYRAYVANTNLLLPWWPRQDVVADATAGGARGAGRKL